MAISSINDSLVYYQLTTASLPVEILTHLYTYFTEEELGPVAQLNKESNNIAKDVRFRKLVNDVKNFFKGLTFTFVDDKKPNLITKLLDSSQLDQTFRNCDTVEKVKVQISHLLLEIYKEKGSVLAPKVGEAKGRLHIEEAFNIVMNLKDSSNFPTHDLLTECYSHFVDNYISQFKESNPNPSRVVNYIFYTYLFKVDLLILKNFLANPNNDDILINCINEKHYTENNILKFLYKIINSSSFSAERAAHFLIQLKDASLKVPLTKQFVYDARSESSSENHYKKVVEIIRENNNPTIQKTLKECKRDFIWIRAKEIAASLLFGISMVSFVALCISTIVSIIFFTSFIALGIMLGLFVLFLAALAGGVKLLPPTCSYDFIKV